MKTLTPPIQTATSVGIHLAVGIINLCLEKREGPSECDWDRFLMALADKIIDGLTLNENNSKNLRSYLETLRTKFKGREKILRDPEYLENIYHWINTCCLGAPPAKP